MRHFGHGRLIHRHPSGNSRLVATQHLRRLIAQMQEQWPASRIEVAGLTPRCELPGDSMYQLMATGLIIATSLTERERRLLPVVLQGADAVEASSPSALAEMRREIDVASMGRVFDNALSPDPAVRWQCHWIAYALQHGLERPAQRAMEDLHITLTDY